MPAGTFLLNVTVSLEVLGLIEMEELAVALEEAGSYPPPSSAGDPAGSGADVASRSIHLVPFYVAPSDYFDAA